MYPDVHVLRYSRGGVTILLIVEVYLPFVFGFRFIFWFGVLIKITDLDM